MIRNISKGFHRIFAILALLALTASISRAGILNGHPDAYAGWTGSVPYLSFSTNLSGTIDYAVFTAADFNANFGGQGYVPAGPLVYTYQVNNTGVSFVSTEIVGIVNIATVPDTFGPINFNDVVATSSSFDGGGNAVWTFSPNSIPSGQSSYGLVFSSPQIPMVGAARTVNGGESTISLGVPTPSPIFIPEPSSLVLGGASLVWCAIRRRRK